MSETESPFDIPVSSGVLTAGSEETKLSRRQATQLLAQMFAGSANPQAAKAAGSRSVLENWAVVDLGTDMLYGNETDTTYEQAFEAMMAVAIIDSLPVEARDANVLQGFDYRPYFATVAANPEMYAVKLGQYADEIHGDDLGLQATLWRDSGGIAWNLVAGDLADDPEKVARFAGVSQSVLTARNVEFLRAQAEAGGLVLTDAELASAQMVPATVTMSPAAQWAVNAQPAGGVAVDLDGDGKLSPEEYLAGEQDALGEPFVMSRSDIEGYFRSGIFDMTTMIEDEYNKAVQTGDRSPNYGFDTGAMRGGGPRRGPVSAGLMTAQQALDYMHSLSDEDAVLMQTRLAESGYFERIGKIPEFQDGDDEATNEAWMLALNESAQQGMSIPKLLNSQRERIRTTKAQTMQQFKVTDVRNAANQFGQDVLGRNLSGAEFDQVRTFLKSLQTQRRDDVLGVDDTSWYREGMDPDVGFDSTDIEAAVDRTTQGAEDLQSGWDTGKKLFKMIGMDFPTVPTQAPKEQ